MAISPPPYAPKVACFNFGMCGRVLDVINHDKFNSIGSGVSPPRWPKIDIFHLLEVSPLEQYRPRR